MNGDNESMRHDGLYSIGEMSKICNVSKKTLRFYDKIGLISPDYVSETTGYRYYKEETLLFVPVIKYFKQMGFKLEEMKSFLESNLYDVHIDGFRKQIEELRQQREDIFVAYTSVSDWYDLIIEAESVIDNNAVEVSVKFLEHIDAPCMEFEFDNNYMESIINIEWTNYLESIGQSITGPVYIVFSDYISKLKGKPVKAIILQKGIRDIRDNNMVGIGGRMMLSAYHIGPHSSISRTYGKMLKWAKQHGYKVSGKSIERYVTDYWTSRQAENFVTEILIPLV